MNGRPVLSWRLAGLTLGSAPAALASTPMDGLWHGDAPDWWPPGATGVMVATAAPASRRLQSAPGRNRRVP